jgi:hypothetical protein
MKPARQRIVAVAAMCAVVLLTACAAPTKARKAEPSPTGVEAAPSKPVTVAVPSVDQFALASYVRIDAHADPKGGTPVHIVPRDFAVRVHMHGLKQLNVLLTFSATETVATAPAIPDAAGIAQVRFHLPRADEVYVIQAYRGIGSDGRPVQVGGIPSIRVKAEA